MKKLFILCMLLLPAFTFAGCSKDEMNLKPKIPMIRVAMKTIIIKNLKLRETGKL